MENLIAQTPDLAYDSGSPADVGVPRSGSDQPPSAPLKGSDMSKPHTKLVAVLAVVSILAGVGTGWGATRLQGKTGLPGGSGNQPIQQVATGNVQAGDVFGVTDEKTFKDSADGYLEAGGLDGEGSHRLLRVGGDSQTVYLTSSVTDLDKFVGMEVKVWGETFQGQNVGWLMDVGRVQIVNPQGVSPEAE